MLLVRQFPDVIRQKGECRELEEHGYLEAHRELVLDAHHEIHRGQGVAAEVEEVVLGSDARFAEDVRPYGPEPALHVRR